MGVERGRGHQRIVATNVEEEFSLFADQPNQAESLTATIAAAQPAPTDALAAQIAQLTTLLSRLSTVVNQPGF